MTTTQSQFRPIEIMCGVKPSTDCTPASTQHYTASYGVRSVSGNPEKIGGNYIYIFSYNKTIDGTARSVFSAEISNQIKTIIGTEKKLYSLDGSVLTNITPLVTGTIAIANSLATHYATLANNPVHTTISTGTLVIDDTEAAKFQAGDLVTLTGASTTNGILNTAINAQHIIRSIGTNQYTIIVSGSASSTGAGGGAAVVRSSGLLTVTAAAHGLANGERVLIAAAANTGGILAASINLEFIIRNITPSTLDVMTSGTATSSIAAGGGAATTYRKQIPTGNVNELAGQGYGMGLYGVGLYGTALISAAARSLPRIWFDDRFADTIILTAGNQTGVYAWSGSLATAPALLSGAPTAVNYVFVSDSIVVTFGADGVPNRVFSSAQGDPTNWVSSSTNAVFDDNIEGAGRFLSHVPVNGLNIIFTSSRCYTMRFIGIPLIWQIDLLEGSTGIIAPMARCTAHNLAFWMAAENFYMWDGSGVRIIPANSEKQTTLYKYVFKNITLGQKSKIFAWHNQLYDEVWFHIPSAASNEPDTVARVSLQDFSWWPDVMDRTAAEYPIASLYYPRLMSTPTGATPAQLRIHEYGTDNDVAPLSWSLSSPYTSSGRITANNVTIIPDSVQTGDINLHVNAKQYPQSMTLAVNKDFTVTTTTEKVETGMNGRYFQYIWSGSVLGQEWQMGTWQSDIQPSYPQ